MDQPTRPTSGRLSPLAHCGLAFLLAILVGLARLGGAQAGVNEWTSTGPEGGVINALAIDPETSGVLYAGTFSGLFKSTTAGTFWTPIKDFSELPVFAVAINPQAPALLYAGTSSGVFKSINGGASWSLSLSTSALALAIDPQNPAIVYAGTFAAEVFKTTDGGATWTPSSSGLPNNNAIRVLAIDPVTSSTLYAGTEGTLFGHPANGVFKSTDGGSTWSPRNSGLANLDIKALAIDPRAPSIVYAGTQGSSDDGIFKSTNGGTSWSPSSSGLPSFPIPLALVFDPQTPGTLHTGTFQGVFRSTNDGASWSPSSFGLPDIFPASIINALAIDPHAPSTLYAGSNGGGVFKTVDGGTTTWASSNTSFTAGQVVALAIDPQNAANLLASTNGDGVFKSTNGGGSWNASNSGLGSNCVKSLAINPQTPATVYAATECDSSSGVYKSIDGGANWVRTGVGLLAGRGYRALSIDPQTPQTPDTLYVGTSGEGVFKSTNGARSWSPASSGLPNELVSALAIDAQTPTTLYASISSGGVFKTINGGSSWSPSSSGLPTNDSFAALAIDPQSSAILYVGASAHGLFKTNNGASSWSPSNSGLPGPVSALTVVPQLPSTVYAGVFGRGVFKSTNGGASWSSSNVDLTNFGVDALAVNPTGTCLHAGTAGGTLDFATQADLDCPSPPSLVAAILPSSRSVRVGTGVTAFASIINVSSISAALASAALNTGGVDGVTCGITQLTGLPTPFTFQATDPATNLPIGTPNTPVNIAPRTSQTFVISLTPTAAFCSTDVTFGFNCGNTKLAPSITGVNTLLFSASSTAVPDIIALAATLANDGVVNIPGATGTGVFAVATTNVGVSGTITVTADTGGVTSPVSATLCRTDPPTGQCLAPPAPTVTTQINATATATFGVFVTGSAPVPFEPATNRVFVRFQENVTCATTSGMVTRGATSVAVRTQ